MVFVYLSFGILLVVILHNTLRFLSDADPRSVRKSLGWGFGALIVLVVFLLLRFGLIPLAAIVSLIGVLTPLFQRMQTHKQQAAPSTTRMNRKEALEILDLHGTPDAKTIHAAHRRLIQKNHPDQGGSAYLASKINEARDVLLAEAQEQHP